ncbi:MAG: FKBP-type peptidyl-prolyl cis-trans isomerase [Bacteroidetes bacterium]|jgi:FKBP-type peptidyl-prolyl cis-trans isomerase|nr:FKBP-type peptidyl-prolyl cis-trans isomerase [Bacteroidota bacterium]MBX7128847.1 FKBP-type peptidyl-prolyl cis-trans isomerase [Flavobacteriales bacterium]MCC6654261.1 FKBP-type peptidyl-prolyl cis-trans isomerase [Flavobacteriales bacterium]HMU14570.1 FKBP-type peptidyl-prolyl cis-trans isomerase [Flavobacteriales bacterium]HMW98603.1 FKBP-type peptidyl-prolyl cis-trans isomerase [Flavobacteriales bacterium]
MNLRLPLLSFAAILLSACTDQVAGQKGVAVPLKTNVDSVSYALGTDIGHNMKESGLEELNVQALAMGISDGIDSTEKITSESVRTIVQAYMMEAQKKVMARQAAAGEAQMRKGEDWLLENGKKPGVQTTTSGLQYEVITAGTGPKPTDKDAVSVHYRGTLINSDQPFDSSYDRGAPATFALGPDAASEEAFQVIPGLTEALLLMPVGSKWKVFIPQNLGYGAAGAGRDIPPYSPLIFEVELLGIAPKGK